MAHDAPHPVIDGLADVPQTVDDAVRQTIDRMLASPEQSDQKDPSFEVLHYRTGMLDPLARISTARPLNIVGAVARFVWMIAGSNRLEDIRFYERQVKDYTDDGLTVPGSSYGKRLFDAAPGLDQIRGVVDRLRDDPSSRRAAAVVWVPQDAVRPSKDIPCTFGLFFHIRAGQLVMRTVMRSNNAYRLMPYNFFEFSLLGEVVAATVGVPLGAYLHDAASMHVLDKDVDEARALLDGPAGTSLRMERMPSGREGNGSALEQAAKLAQYEAKVRHAYTRTDFDRELREASATLDPYWMHLLNVLAAWGAAARGWTDAVDTLCNSLPTCFAANARTRTSKKLGEATPADPARDALTTTTATGGQSELALDLPDLTAPDRTADLVAFNRRDANNDAVWLALIHQLQEDPSMFRADEIPTLRDIILETGVYTSARSAVPSDGALNDAVEVTPETIRAAVRRLREN